MKKIIIGIMALTSLSSFSAMAQVANIQQCSDKVSKTVKAVASIELGKDNQIVEITQDALSTATNFKVTVNSNKEQAQLVYRVKTVNITSKYPCVVDTVKLSNN